LFQYNLTGFGLSYIKTAEQTMTQVLSYLFQIEFVQFPFFTGDL